MLAHSLAASGYVDKEWMHWRLVFFFLALQWTEVCPPSRQLSRPQLMIQGPNLSALSMCAPPVRRHSGGCQLGSPEEPGGGGGHDRGGPPHDALTILDCRWQLRQIRRSCEAPLQP